MLEKNNRNSKIDSLRAFAMMWVIFVHCVYWLNVFSSSWGRSLILFEMPLIFFVTGAANYKSKDKFFKFLGKRIIRIYLPYLVYAILCLGIILIFNKSEFTINTILTWIIPLDNQVSAFTFSTYALWFITAYLIIVPFFFPLFKICFDKAKKLIFKLLPLIVIIFCFVIAQFLPTTTFYVKLIKTVLFYMIFTYMGMFFWSWHDYLSKGKTRILFAILFVIVVGVAIILYFLGMDVDMQNNKFPPNIMFMLYSFAMMILIYYLSDIINKGFMFISKIKVFDFFITQYKQHSCSVFLYQTFGFWAYTILFNKMELLIRLQSYDVLYLLISLLIMLPVCAVLAFIFSIFEKLSAKILR